jgi:SAM-dependent methyltransferase
MPFEELKQRQSLIWGNGPYERVSATIADLHEAVLERLGPRPGEQILDLACGTGLLTERIARTGASATGVDLAPVLIETASRRAAEQNLAIVYRVGDCEDLREITSGSFDGTTSTCGIMFAPDHEAVARELGRVTRRGGRVVLANWEPDGGLGQMFKLMAPYQPPPPPGIGNPFDWGREEHVRHLLGDDFELHFEHLVSKLEIESGEEYWELFSSSYGPTKTLAESLDSERREKLHQEWVDFFETEYPGRSGGVEHTREYLLVRGTRR